MSRLFTIPLLLCALCLSCVAYAQAVIQQISFQGNSKTRDVILRQELTIRVGEPLDPAAIEASRQALMNLGLFRSVTADWSEDGGVVFTVKEKSYFYALPRFHQDEEGGVYPGIYFNMDNLGGLNQRLRFIYQEQSADDAARGSDRGLDIRYIYPRIAGSHYRLDLRFDLEQRPLQLTSGNVVTADYDRDILDTSFLISRWLSRHGPSQGWLLGFGLHFQHYEYTHRQGTMGLFDTERSMGFLGQILYTDVHDHLYSRTGEEYGYALETSLSQLGSDHRYNRHLVYLRRYLPLGKPHRNLNYQLRLGLSSGRINSTETATYEIGGSDLLRGYDENLRGDAYVLLNVEYLQPLFGKNAVRGVVFLDVGDAFARNSDIRLTDLKTAVGLGLRIKVKRFVDLDVRIDGAYNVDTGGTEWYLSNRSMF